MTDTTAAAPRLDRTTEAVLWMFGALTCFSFVAVAGREASRTLTTLELIAYRSWLSLAILIALLWLSGTGFAGLKSERLRLHGMRGIIHFGAQFCWLKALTLIPLAQLFALEFTSPLWVALLAPLVLGERLTPWRIAAGLIGFVGVLVTIGGARAELSPGEVLALISALGFAFSMMMTKMLTRTDSASTILFYMFLLQTIVTLPIIAVEPRLPTIDALAWASGVAVGGMGAHYALTRAFAAADAMVVAPLDFLRLPLIAVVGALLYQETVAAHVIVGGAVIVLANTINIWGERRRIQRAP